MGPVVTTLASNGRAGSYEYGNAVGEGITVGVAVGALVSMAIRV